MNLVWRWVLKRSNFLSHSPDTLNLCLYLSYCLKHVDIEETLFCCNGKLLFTVGVFLWRLNESALPCDRGFGTWIQLHALDVTLQNGYATYGAFFSAHYMQPPRFFCLWSATTKSWGQEKLIDQHEEVVNEDWIWKWRNKLRFPNITSH